MRYRLLAIDHDDTAVDSTAVIHYPAHLEALRVLRPGLPQPSIEEWWSANFDPGIMEHLVQHLGMNETELWREFEIWRSFTTSRVPPFFPGFRELLADFRDRGGRVAVVSHSERQNILRDYRQPGGPAFEPDLVFGWDHDPARRKPDPWPVREALARLGLAADEALVLDDLRPGVLMARSADIAAVGAGWAHRVPRIRDWMRENCLAYFETIDEFGAFLLG
jgi:beta-phosphoglucomutase-like phosphatase (HAD superfamily)